MELKDIKTLKEVGEEHNVLPKTLMNRFRLLIASGELEENKDYKKLGDRMPILLAPSAVDKLISKGRKN